jgi:hypothetical protein
MLQSLKLEVDVIGPGPRSDAVEPPGGGIDYLATGYLAAIDDLQPAQLNVFVNEGVDGTHWIGVFHEHGAALDLRAGTMRTLAPEALETQTRVLRDTLADIQGVKAKYQYAAAWDAVKDDAKAMERRARRIVELAQRGWETFAAVLFAGDVPPGEQVHTLADAHGECLVSVARCTGSSPSVPWAATTTASSTPDRGRRSNPRYARCSWIRCGRTSGRRRGRS